MLPGIFLVLFLITNFNYLWQGDLIRRNFNKYVKVIVLYSQHLLILIYFSGMNSIETEYQVEKKRGPGSSLLFLVFMVLCGLFVGQFVGVVVIMMVSGQSIESLAPVLADPLSQPDVKNYLFILQGVSVVFGFILAPILHQLIIDKTQPSTLFHTKNLKLIPILVVGFIALTMMVANSAVIEWNMAVDYSWLSPGFEEWAKVKETELRELTEFLTTFDSFGSFIAGFFIIAILPAIGEEYVFRGLLQPKLQNLTGNHHMAIWLTAFIFSAIHLQFYGFVPRMLLGGLFGYLYFWSGNLLYPMIAHFVNNGFTVLMMYMFQQKMTDFDVDATESVPTTTVLLTLLVGVGLVIYFRNFFRKPVIQDAG